jgi:hypothetical protein
MDYIMSWVTAGDTGIRLGDYIFTDLDYADDAALFDENHGKLRDLLLQMEDEASKFGLHVSWTKTKTQNLGYGRTNTPISIGPETVEQVDSFCYLGSNMCSMANSRDESIRRIGIASSTLNRLNRIWKQRNLSIKTKFRIYTTLVTPVLLYGCETWTMTGRDWQKIETFHTKAQRRILNIRWSDFIRNDEVYSQSGQNTMYSQIRHRRLGLFGHVARLPTVVPASAALQLATTLRNGDSAIPGWRRPRGRPPITWLHQVSTDCGLPISEALLCAQDRTLWRTIATATPATRE